MRARPRSAGRRSCAPPALVSTANTTHSSDQQQDREPPVDVERQRQQHQQRHDRRRNARGRNPSHSRHSASVPASITFISRPEWVPVWKVSGNCSTCSKKLGQHRLALAVRQPIGVQRDRDAAADGEQAERRPGRQQRPRRRWRTRSGGRFARKARRRCGRTAPARRIGRRPAADWRRRGSSPAAPPCRATQGRGYRGEAWTCHGLRVGGTNDRLNRHSNQGLSRRYSVRRHFTQLIRRPPSGGRKLSSKISAAEGRFLNLKPSAIWSISGPGGPDRCRRCRCAALRW